MEYNIRYVAIYLRKSRGEEEDLQKHQIVLKEICSKNDWKYVEFKEIGTSDSVEMRPVMQKLLSDIEEDIFDAVLVVDYDRLSRGDMGQQDRIKKIFRKSNTLIITPNKVYDLSNDSDDMYTDFAGLIARQEYKMITKRLRQGKKVGSMIGNWTNGSPPFPYVYEKYKDKFNEKGLVIDDEKLKIYKYIVEKALQGVPPYEIAWELNRQSIPSPRGKTWSNVTIYRLLKDETHLGKIISNKQKGDGHKIKKSDSEEFRRLPKNEWVVIENCHEPVISEFEFCKIEDMMSKRAIVPVSARAGKNDLSGILKCSICGYSMSLYRKKDGKLYIKPCSHTDEYGNKCVNKGQKADDLYENIKKAIIQYRDEVLENLENSNSKELQSTKNNLELKYKEVDKYSKVLEKVNDSYDIGDYSRDEWLNRKSKWESKLGQIEEDITILNKSIKIQD
ncbi:recombinase family protein [Clostridium estertheticum]|uniref:recombinase family protein n=1 Tax=Clostridium estertheticum TaxID=238834 RepID=UPI001C0BA6BD|nr:recombinase family protein [Clostridium estertheticum]MBU3177646.1 recombinase family protein [Clostridium estertheticum]